MKKIVNEDGAIFMDEECLIYLNLSNRCPSTIGLKDVDDRICDLERPCKECVKQAFDEVEEVELKLLLKEDKDTTFTGTIECEPYEDEYEETITNDFVEDLFVHITKAYNREDIEYLTTLLSSYLFKNRGE